MRQFIVTMLESSTIVAFDVGFKSNQLSIELYLLSISPNPEIITKYIVPIGAILIKDFEYCLAILIKDYGYCFAC